MSGKFDGHRQRLHSHEALTTEQIRAVGQRRRAAEEKLEHHLHEARQKTGQRNNRDGEPADLLLETNVSAAGTTTVL